MSPDYSKAIVSLNFSEKILFFETDSLQASSKRILILLRREPSIDNSSSAGETIVSRKIKKLLFYLMSCLIVQDNFQGRIKLQNIEFRYPNRTEVQVLKDFQLTIEPSITGFCSLRKKRNIAFHCTQINRLHLLVRLAVEKVLSFNCLNISMIRQMGKAYVRPIG